MIKSSLNTSEQETDGSVSTSSNAQDRLTTLLKKAACTIPIFKSVGSGLLATTPKTVTQPVLSVTITLKTTKKAKEPLKNGRRNN
jgi:hypothetical protein